MIVCIAEKPSVAQEIANILGATNRHQGYLEGNGYQVTWTYGHLCELKYPEDYTPLWKGWNLGALPMVPPRFGIRLKDDQGVRKQFAVIEQLMSKAERIVNCGDAGQEGELIQRWVMQKAGAHCPVDRLWISSLTEESIREGFQTLRPQEEYKPLYEAGLCRAIGDWLLGMNATRLYTLKYGDRSKRGAQPLSIGRVQTPTLALIVKRQMEIDHFKPEPYWVLTTVYRDTTFNAVMADPNDDEPADEKAESGDKKKEAAPAKKGFATEEEGRAALERIRTEPFIVTSVEKKKGTEMPPRLYDLTSLQVDCNKKFGFSADQTLQLIQSLYEKKFTTYPRVDTTYLSEDIYPKCGPILNGISGRYGELLMPLRGAKLLKRKKVFDSSKVTDHHAIIPTGVAPQNLSDMEMKVFDLVARRFISVFYPDCKFATTTVLGEAADVPFKATGKLILEPGWRAVYQAVRSQQQPAENDEERPDDAERTLPDFVRGESGPHTPDLTQKMTQPPRPYTEATLLRAMETAGRTVEDEELRDVMKENGIGRPSTRAAIIETLFRRQYIRRQRKNILATPTGIKLIAIIKEELLKSAELTGRWERKLRLIEQQQYSAPQFIGELKQMVQEIVTQVLSDNSARRVSEAAAPAQPDAPSVHPSAPESGGEAAAAPQPKPRKRIIRAGSICPQCGIGKVIKGHTAYGCSRWKEGCDWRKPF
ncbi:DNA topoisomerase 3 [bacterium]|nr:DNA topoisomerase 3 [bacterium]